MTHPLVAKAEQAKFEDLFLRDLFWDARDHPPIEVELADGSKLTATNVSSYQRVRVWAVPALPGSADEATVDKAIARTSTNRLLIFHKGDKQVWRWPSRTTKGSGVISRPARHVHKTGSPDPQFAAKLEAIRLPTDVRLDVNELLSRVRGAFDVETKNETKRASKLMAQMYAAVEKGYAAGVDPRRRDHEISVTLARALFLLFGDDTEMWKDANSGEPITDLFQDFIKDHTERDGTDIAERINALFTALNTAPAERGGMAAELAAFPYVNGGIFDEKITLPDLDSDLRNALLAASAVDWSTISPAIFGSMFQSVRDAQTRHQLGEHYTSEENILKTLNPLFLDELRAEYDAALARDTVKKKTNALNALWAKLGDIRYMDPACGCGNFIIVAYRELREIELNIMLAIQDLTGSAQLAFDPTLSLKVTLDHFYGIEIDEWPARIAETAMFLIDRQSDLKLKERFGIAPERLPITKAATIVVGNALTQPWEGILLPAEDVVVAGNPPFLGHKERTAVQGEELREAWGRTSIGHLDYVTAWYAKAIAYFDGIGGRWAFVSTNSVVQGETVPLLFGALHGAGWRIKFAHRTFQWASEAAGQATVQCVIIGFSRSAPNPRLFVYDSPKGSPKEHLARNINPYLVDADDILVEPRSSSLAPDLPEISAGSTPIDWNFLCVGEADLAAVRADGVAAKYLRRYVGGKELIHDLERWCLWMDTPEFKQSDIAKSPVLKARVDGVRKRRGESGRAATKALAATPHLFGERRQPSGHYLGIPQTFSENRPFATAARLDATTIASIKLFTAPDPDGFLFAIVSSSMFITWQKTVGGRLESRPSFSSSVVWRTLPLPQLAEGIHISICRAGATIVKVRARYLDRTLAELYDPIGMPDDLLDAHRVLDELVDKAFGAKELCTDEEARQEVLFKRYKEMTAAELHHK